MRRRQALSALGLSALAIPFTSFAQSKAPRVHRIGILFGASPAVTAQAYEEFKKELRAQGFVDGQDVILDPRYGEGKVEQIAHFAAELVRMKSDVIVTGNDPTIAAVKRETETIPIVMANSTDPVGTGFIASLARPGGNITGLSTMSPELSGKRLELLKEVVPGMARVAIVWNPDVRGALFDYKETEAAARTLRLQLQSVEVRQSSDLERAFAAMVKQRAQGVIVQTPNPVLFVRPGEVASLARRDRLPAIFGQVEFANAGGLMSYGSNTTERYRRAAVYVAKILKGPKPAELPVEQPTRFELVVNLKTAKALGITLPPTVMVRADRVIE